jgi:hypothetical protein
MSETKVAWEAGRDCVVGHLRYRIDAYRRYDNEHARLAIKYLTEAAEYAKGLTPPLAYEQEVPRG